MSNNDEEPVEKPRQDKTKPKREWCSFPRAVEDSISAGLRNSARRIDVKMKGRIFSQQVKS